MKTSPNKNLRQKLQKAGVTIKTAVKRKKKSKDDKDHYDVFYGDRTSPARDDGKVKDLYKTITSKEEKKLLPNLPEDGNIKASIETPDKEDIYTTLVSGATMYGEPAKVEPGSSALKRTGCVKRLNI